MSVSYFDILLRTLAAAYITAFASQICKDAGEEGLAMGVELAEQVGSDDHRFAHHRGSSGVSGKSPAIGGTSVGRLAWAALLLTLIISSTGSTEASQLDATLEKVVEVQLTELDTRKLSGLWPPSMHS